MSLVCSSPTSNRDPPYSFQGTEGDEDLSPFVDASSGAFLSQKRTSITSTPPLNANLEPLTTLANLSSCLPMTACLPLSSVDVAGKKDNGGRGKKMRAGDCKVCGCGECVPPDHQAAHDERCPEKITACDFAVHGCFYVCRREDMARHHASSLAVHSKLLCDQLRRVEAVVNNPLLTVCWQVHVHGHAVGGVDTSSSDFSILVSGVLVNLYLTAKTTSTGRLGVYVNRHSDLSAVSGIDIAGTTITLHCSEDITRIFPANSILEPSSNGLGYDFCIGNDSLHPGANGLTVVCKFRASPVDPVIVLTTTK